MGPLVLSIGESLRDYRVRARLESGGMGEIYLAERRGAAGFVRTVALKVMHRRLARDPELVRLFIEEARLGARISHPHVVHVEEFGEVDGCYFLAMEYVRGCSLGHLLRRLGQQGRRMPESLAVLVAAQIAAGLRAVHEASDERGAPLGLVHRDVSPHNVLLAENGYAKLIDLGIAKVTGGNGPHTASGHLRGKLGYMAPEQAWGRQVDARTDVYALGVVLWEMLAMRRLFHAKDEMALLETVRAPAIPTLSEIVPGVSAALESVVLAALAPRVEDRPASAAALRRMLVEALPGGRLPEPDALAALIHEHLEADEFAPSPNAHEDADATVATLDPPQDTAWQLAGATAAPAAHDDAPGARVDTASEPTPVTKQAGRAARRRGTVPALALLALGLGSAVVWWTQWRDVPAHGVAPSPARTLSTTPGAMDSVVATQPAPPRDQAASARVLPTSPPATQPAAATTSVRATLARPALPRASHRARISHRATRPRVHTRGVVDGTPLIEELH